METKIALQLYSIRTAMEKDFFGALTKVKQAGYDSVEFAGYGGYSAGELRARLAEIGLDPYSSHVGAQLLEEELDEVVAFSRELGLSWVVCPGHKTETLADCKKISSILVRAAQALQPYGIRVGYHNHSHEFVKFGDSYALDLIIANDAGVAITAEVDTCWAQYADVDPVAYIDSLGDLAGPLHFKDINAGYKDMAGQDINVEVGNGMIDFPAIIKVARRNGILERGLIVEQEAFTRDMFESIKISCDNIKKMLA